MAVDSETYGLLQSENRRLQGELESAVTAGYGAAISLDKALTERDEALGRLSRKDSQIDTLADWCSRWQDGNEELTAERDEVRAKYREALDRIIDLEWQLGESLIELSEKSGV